MEDAKEVNILNPRDENVIKHIDYVLEDYDRIIEASNWADLQMMVDQGIMDIETANHRMSEWLARRHPKPD